MIQKGKEFITKDGDKYHITSYNNSNDVHIEFDSGETQKVKLSDIYSDSISAIEKSTKDAEVKESEEEENNEVFESESD